MPSDLYWIDAPLPFRLAIMARPRACDWLEDEVAHWQAAGIEVVVSLLERDEIDDLGLSTEAVICGEHGIQYLSFPIPDRSVPSDAKVALDFADQLIDIGKAIAIHCRAGIGRSSVIAAVVMMRCDISANEALSAIERARGMPVPDTDAQRDWVLALQETAAKRPHW
jgi:protein-tyrosine phosphatase